MTVELKGLVLRSVKYGESDKLITALTEEGILFFQARGIRIITSKNAAGCQSFVYSEFLLHKKADKYYLRSARPLYSTVRAGASLPSLALASYLASLAEDTARDAETGKIVLRLLMNALYLLAKEDRPTDQIKSVFEIRLLAANGLMPQIGECAVCGKDSSALPSLFFRLTEGDVVCPDCLSALDAECHRVSREVLALCRHCMESGEEKAYAVRIPEALLRDFARFTEKYLIRQMDRTYSTLEFYHEVKRLGNDDKLEKAKQNESI